LLAGNLETMKMVSDREFYRNPSLVDGLTEGQQLEVISNGQTKFIVTKSVRPQMTAALAEQRAVGEATGASFDGTAFLRSLKK